MTLPEAAITVHATPETLKALRDLLSLTIPGVEDWLGERLRWAYLNPGESIGAGNATVTPFSVDHGLECVGVEQGGSAMIYAADTSPCQNVVEYSREANLLVHEAYGLEDTAKRAHAFGLSTAGEAGRAARAAGVGRLILTHLRSNRFVDPQKRKTEASSAFGGPVEVARDLDVFDY